MIKDNSKISQLKSTAEEYLLPPSYVDFILKEIASDLSISSLGVKINIRDEVDHKWGDCSGTVIVESIINRPNNIKIFIITGDAAKHADMNIQTAMHQLLVAFMAVWASDYRNEHGGLTLKASAISDVLPGSVNHVARQAFTSKLTIAWIDLDKFKQINDLISHEAGDKALRSVYAAMHQLARRLNGLAFFDGGDEFILILPSTQSVQKMQLISEVWKFRNEIKDLRYPKADGSGDLILDLTVGVVERTVNEINSDLIAVKTACEVLTKKEGGDREKRRGTINFEPVSNAIPVQAAVVDPLNFFQLGFCLSRCVQFVEHAFADERLNLIVEKVMSFNLAESLTPESISEAVNDVLTWFGVEQKDDFDESHLLNSPADSRQLSKGAIAIAIVHGLAISIRKQSSVYVVSPLCIRWADHGVKIAVQSGERTIWGDSSLESGNSDLLQYGVWITHGKESQRLGSVVGVQVGFANKPLTPGAMNLPLSFFVDRILVDDRPITGGGLPDFWQIAIAQIVTALDKAPESKILIWGKDETSLKGTDTYRRLIGEKDWEVDDVMRLTGLAIARIEQLKPQLPNRVKIVLDPIERLNEITESYKVLAGRSSLEATELPIQSTMHRPMMAAEPLGQSEGIICQTAAMAYPLVIDTLRKSSDVRLPRDDSNQEHRELLAFKVKLITPSKDSIPFYLKEQKNELENYAEEVFLKTDGLIRKEIEELGQVEAFITHLSSYFGTDSKDQKSTRRACLVVPHKPNEDAREPKPLGLISVWATPRFIEGKKFLDFVFVWRTVEAFIGLPYSLFGSIKLAEVLVSSISERVNTQGSLSAPQLGELTYIALSLHLGNDEFHKRVAKQIVDSASD